MLNTDPRWQAYFADLEKETNGEILREDLAYGMLQLYRSHNYNVSKQGAIDSAFFEDFDPDPAPGIPRRKCPVPSDEEWGKYYQIDQDGNITMEDSPYSF